MSQCKWVEAGDVMKDLKLLTWIWGMSKYIKGRKLECNEWILINVKWDTYEMKYDELCRGKDAFQTISGEGSL